MMFSRLIVGFGSIFVLLGLVISHIAKTPRYALHECDLGEYRCHVMWSETWSTSKTEYALFVPRMPDGLGMVASWGKLPTTPIESIHDDAVYTIPEGLFVNGERIDSRENGQVFALIHPRQAIPIELKADELALFSRRNIESLGTTSLWKDRVLPLLEKHGWDPSPFGQQDATEGLQRKRNAIENSRQDVLEALTEGGTR